MEHRGPTTEVKDNLETSEIRRILIAEPEDIELLNGHLLPSNIEQEIKDGKAYGLLEYEEGRSISIRVKNKESHEIVYLENYDWTDPAVKDLRKLESNKSNELTKEETEDIRTFIANNKMMSTTSQYVVDEIDRGNFLIRIERDKNSGNMSGIFMKHKYRDIEYFFNLKN